MLFHEIYGSYFAVTAAILKKALSGGLTRQEIRRITARSGFGESILTIPEALSDGTWPLLDPQMKTPLQHVPAMPPTLLELRWLKTISENPRVRLFSPSVEGLEDVPPLYDPSDILWFDRNNDGDPFEDPVYKEHFRTIRRALHEKKHLHIRYAGKRSRLEGIFFPLRLEYSEKDDKFRLYAVRAMNTAPESAGADGDPGNAVHALPDGEVDKETHLKRRYILNLTSILECSPANPAATAGGTAEMRLPVHPGESDGSSSPPPRAKETIVLELLDRRNALERAMLHFSDLEKETVPLGGDRYRILLRCQAEDETEILIRILAFGPVIRVLSPEGFVEQIRERIRTQRHMGAIDEEGNVSSDSLH